MKCEYQEGERFGLVIVLERNEVGAERDGAVRVRIRCTCGVERWAVFHNIKKAPPKSHRACLREQQLELPTLGRPRHGENTA